MCRSVLSLAGDKGCQAFVAPGSVQATATLAEKTLDWILPCWPDYMAAAQLLTSVFQARRELLTHGQKKKNQTGG